MKASQKAKPKVPKTEKMWMAWDKVDGGFRKKWYGLSKRECQRKINEDPFFSADFKPIRVRIMPEAEYQRLRKAKKGGK